MYFLYCLVLEGCVIILVLSFAWDSAKEDFTGTYTQPEWHITGEVFCMLHTPAWKPEAYLVTLVKSTVSFLYTLWPVLVKICPKIGA